MNIPVKPDGALWTDDQWKAIWAEGRDILVAAAAGSGKTAVLVERLIQKMIREHDPVDVDELLVVTFTNAAAAEMRERIGAALEREIEQNPSSTRLRRQLRLLNKASISTLHSFCLDVIRKYYYMVDIDPSFRIADDTEAAFIRDEVIEALLEEEYAKENNERFFELVDTFSGDRSDDDLQEAVMRLYHFSRAHPSPDEWLQSLGTLYGEFKSVDELPFIEPLKKDIRLQLEQALALLQEGEELSHMPGGPAPRAAMFQAEAAMAEALLQCRTWEEWYEQFQLVKFPTLKMVKGEEYDDELKERSKQVRDEAKKIIMELKDTFFSRKPASWLNDLTAMQPVVEQLAALVDLFANRYELAKKDRGLADYNDLEHYALAILQNSDGTPSKAAEAYQRRFKEVLIDEYQDVNMVQETIVRLVSKNSESAGNVFMVGDIKQSIYRFRLAEPGLFLDKYTRFQDGTTEGGMKISLSQNFRSRREVLDGTNFIFTKIMGQEVGEMTYGDEESLVPGADYPEEAFPIEVVMIDTDGVDIVSAEEEALEDAEQSHIESRLIASKIKDMVASGKLVYDAKTKTKRPVQYRDIVILMRSMTWVPEMMEEMKQAGIPVYANTSGGYFQSTEISVMLSLLSVIDNPYQDIPLAAVLRSPIVRCTEDELASIRIASKKGTYFEALLAFMEQSDGSRVTQEKLSPFMKNLEKWRSIGRSGALADLIWVLYRDTQFYSFAGGMPGGKQRQANLRALYDRARQYEETSFRGLFRFLRFIDRMRQRGDDLGVARSLSEQEDVVRIMTIHASKGLEFPVVFTAAAGRSFNTMDLSKKLLFDKDYGVAVKYMNAEKRISWPSLVQLAFQRKKKLELLAEEMRVLYVAMTRAKEKLIITASVKKLEQKQEKWQREAAYDGVLLRDAVRASAASYIDWIGPALLRHESMGGHESHAAAFRWTVADVKELTRSISDQEEADAGWLDVVKEGDLFPASSDEKEEIKARMNWVYPHWEAAQLRSKQSVSDLKRTNDIYNDGASTEVARSFQSPVFRRPRFVQEKKLSPAEVGTAVHAVMQHLPLETKPTRLVVEQLIETLLLKELLTEEQAEAVASVEVAAFFDTEPGRMLVGAEQVYREMPFNMGLPAREAGTGETDEVVLVQGVIDCLFRFKGRLYLVDYKTDRIDGRYPVGPSQVEEVMRGRYGRQMALYKQAVERILKEPVEEVYLYFLDGGWIIRE